MSGSQKRRKKDVQKDGEHEEYSPSILTKNGFAEGCERHHITRKDAGLREACNQLILQRIQALVDAALIHADGRGEKILTEEHLKAVAPSAREFPKVLF